MSIRILIDTLYSEIEECRDPDSEWNSDQIDNATYTLDKIKGAVDDIESWNNDVKDVISKAEGSEYLEPLVEELTEPVDNIGREVY